MAFKPAVKAKSGKKMMGKLFGDVFPKAVRGKAASKRGVIRLKKRR